MIWKHNGNGIGCFTEVHLTLTDNTRSQVGAGQSCCLSRDCTECCGSVVRVLPHCHTAILPSAAARPLLAARSLVRREGGREGHPHSSPPQSTPHTTHCPHQATPATTGGAQAQIRGSKLTINQVQLAYLRVSYGGFECGYKLPVTSHVSHKYSNYFAVEPLSYGLL